MSASAPHRIIFAEFRHYPVMPEFGLYTCCHLEHAAGLNMDDMDVIFVQDESDAHLVDQAVREAQNAGAARVTVFLWHYWHCLPHGTTAAFLNLAKRLRALPGVRMITGGLHQTLAPELFAASGLFDAVTLGFPWDTDDWWNEILPGAILRPKAAPSFGPHFRLARSFRRLRNPERILRHGPEGTGTGYYLSFGCREGCRFCYQAPWVSRHGGDRVKPLDMIWEDLEFLNAVCGVSKVDVLDANILEYPTLKEGFLPRMVSHPRLSLYNTLGMRVIDLTPEVLDMARAAGVETIFFGLETLDADIQRKVGKVYNVDHLSAMIEYADSLGLAMEGNMLVGVEAVAGKPLDLDGLGRSIGGFLDWYAKHPNLRIQVRPYMPYRGTPLGDRLWGAGPGLTLERYLELLEAVLFGLPLENKGLQAPPCFADMATYEAVRQAHDAFRTFVAHKASCYKFPPSNPHKAAMLKLLERHCLELARKMQYGFGPFLEETLRLLAQWK